MSKKPTRVFWIVRYRLWGADSESYMWFDRKEDAEKFADRDFYDKPYHKVYLKEEGDLQAMRLNALGLLNNPWGD